ncbi:MAG: phosphoribosylaminoimidazolecarboxamide formyltransferase / IMP cyclohydrolase, partial [Candidatus Peregrinibacteria bacterium Greene0416_62]
MPRALLSVSDKTGIVDFARRLTVCGWEILSTGGTQKTLMDAGIAVTAVEEVTEFPECFGGRVKTMHPKIMGGILMRRDTPSDRKEATAQGIEPIDLVCVNLYPFEETLKKTKEQSSLIEQIDIGGPTLLRSAAKNSTFVTVVCDHADYDRVIVAIENSGTMIELRQELAVKAFACTAAYDALIAETFSGGTFHGVMLGNGTTLRYGENPHQWGKYFDLYGTSRPWRIIQEEAGKPMSYLNLLDADGAWNLVQEFSEPTAACIKHANPSGVASNGTTAEAFQRSYDTDKLSAFGVVVALNEPCTEEIIQKIIDQKIFAEVIIAPGFDLEAIELLKQKPKIRAIEYQKTGISNQQLYRSILGGMLIQNPDTSVVTEKDLTCVTDKKPTKEQIVDMLFSWKVVKHAKSNAIVFAKDLVTVGIGCGQTSRVDSTWIAAKRAGDRAKGAVMASDAFFPFPDSVEEAAKHG